MDHQYLKIALVLLVFIPLLLAQHVDTAWVRYYNAPVNQNDFAAAIAIDNVSNIYVAGTSYQGGAGIFYDYLLIKYLPNGDTAWVRKYDGTGGQWDDSITAMTLDNIGNIYVTGFINAQYRDYGTIKYNPDGVIQWIALYNGLDNLDDIAIDIAVDDSQNVYVTGVSDKQTNWDWVTIKYLPNGDTAWVRRYNIAGSGPDEPVAIAVDNSRNVYVVGNSYISSGESYDWVILKYSPSGSLIWERIPSGQFEDRATGLAIDNTGNIYVTGWWQNSNHDYYYRTIKYNSAGTVQWDNLYNGAFDGQDRASAIALDNNNNVVVTGYSSSQYTYLDYVTIKYTLNGDTMWTRRYNTPDSVNDIAVALAIDDSNNIYVTGYNCIPGRPAEDIISIKYNANGDTMWTTRFNGIGDSTDVVTDIAVDNSFNIYLTGYSHNGTNLDFLIIKYIQGITDIGLVQILLPDSVDSGSVITPQVVIKNYDVTSQTPWIYCKIGTFYADSLSQSIPPGYDTIAFQPCTLTQVGSHIVTSYLFLPGDINPGNDTLLDTIIITATGIFENRAEIKEMFEVLPTITPRKIRIKSQNGFIVYDVSGKKVLEYNNTSLEHNEYNLNLASGVYFIKPNKGNSIVKKIVIIE